MWKHYFGSGCKVYGLDVNPDTVEVEEEQIEVIVGDQADPESLRQVKERIPKMDIVVDDGGHQMNQQITSFTELYPHMTAQGVYLCEDTHSSYAQPPDSTTFVQLMQRMVDQIHAWQAPHPEVSEFTRTTDSIHFYNGVVVVERRPTQQREPEIRGFRKVSTTLQSELGK